jgi:hypothetical protein
MVMFATLLLFVAFSHPPRARTTAKLAKAKEMPLRIEEMI